MEGSTTEFRPLPGVPPSRLGESPFWLPEQAALVWCDIAGRRVLRWRPDDGRLDSWDFDAEVGCCVPLPAAALLVAARDGLWRLDLADGTRRRVAAAPYDTTAERFNDGKADPQGRLWVGTAWDRRDEPRAALYRFERGRFDRIASGITVSNGLAWSPDGRTMYWADSSAHRIQAMDFDGDDGSLSRPRTFAQFAPRPAGADLSAYGGRPDGAAIDVEGAYWVAMYEGGRLLRLAPDDGRVLAEWPLPVRCPTMPCFGGRDGRTLFLTTARERRPADELAREPWAGCVLAMRVDVPGLPVHFALE